VRRADDCVVPITSRCPSCQAAVAPTAAWCSLCHADLRAPEPEADPAPAPPAVDLDLDATDDAPRPRGRHARSDTDPAPRPVTATAPSGSGRHSRAPVALLEGDEVAEPRSSEEVAAYADAMLTRLAISEPAPRFADPSSFPGGRWGLAAAATVVVTLVLTSATAVVGAILG
jgi:hypothetical protein